MRILQVNNHFGPGGGTEQYLAFLANELSRRGHALAFAYGHRLEGAQAFDGPTYEEPALKHYLEPFTAGAQHGFEKVLSDFKPDVVHLHNRISAPIIRWFSKRVPTLRTVHDHETYCFRGKLLFGTEERCLKPLGTACVASGCLGRSPGAWLFYGRVLHHTRQVLAATKDLPRVLVASESMRNHLDFNGISREKISVLPYFIYPPKETAPPQENGVVLFAGRLEQAKGVQVLLKSVSKIRGLRKLVIVGRGEYEPQLRAQAKELAADKIEFLGWQDQPALVEQYRRCAAVVVPSLWPEPFGIVGIEALAQARPVVASQVGGIVEWLRDGQNGFLVPPGNADKMAESLSRLLEDPELARRLGTAGREFVLKHYLAEPHVEALLGHYHALAGVPA